MNTQAPDASLTTRVLTSLGLSPTIVVSVGLVCGVVSPIIAKEGGKWIAAGALLVLITVGCDRIYSLTVSPEAQASRRSLVFVPLAARLTEAAWLYGFWKLGTPPGVVIAAGAISIGHEYIRARGQIAGLRDIGFSTLGERPGRSLSALAGYGVSGAVALTSSNLTEGLATGIVTMAATAWLLLAILGFVQLSIVMSAALRR